MGWIVIPALIVAFMFGVKLAADSIEENVTKGRAIYSDGKEYRCSQVGK